MSSMLHPRVCNSRKLQHSAVTESEHYICISMVIFVTHSSGGEIFWVLLAFSHMHTAVTDKERLVSGLNLSGSYWLVAVIISTVLLFRLEPGRCLTRLKVISAFSNTTCISGHIYFGLKMSDCDHTSCSCFLHHRQMDIFERILSRESDSRLTGQRIPRSVKSSLPRSKQPTDGPCAERFESGPQSDAISLRSILIFSRLRLDLPRGLFPAGFRIKKYSCISLYLLCVVSASLSFLI